MAWQTIRVANPGVAKPPRQLTSLLKSFSPRGERKYVRRRYKCVGGQKVPVRKMKTNPNALTDLLAGDIAAKVTKGVLSSLTGKSHKKRKAVKRKRRNPHLALIGSNPRRKTMAKARRRRRNSLKGRRRNAKGQLMKMSKANPRRRRKSSRRRRNTLAAPRRRRRNRVRVVTKIKYRTRRINVAKRRKRKATRRRSRRRNTALAAVNPRRRRRSRRRRNVAAINPRKRRRSRVTRRRRRRNLGRRNPSFGGLMGRLNLMQVAEVGIGAIAGDKLATWGGSKVASMVGVTDPMMTGLIKAGLGIVGAGFVSKFRPALALGLAVGAVNGLLNEYVFAPYISPYLPLSGGRLGEYVNRTWKEDNWLASGGAPGALAGMGNNSLNRSSL